MLLRVLQSQKTERIGGEQSIRVDIRILAATNRNLLEEVKKGSFREDLFYRLNVIPINLPGHLPDTLKNQANMGPKVLTANEETIIRKVHEESGWNKTVAASNLGISRSTLYEKLKKFNIISPARPVTDGNEKRLKPEEKGLKPRIWSF